MKNLGKPFEKGHVPFNKGKKVTDYVSPEKIEKMQKTQFKEGETVGEKHPSWKGGIQRNKRDGNYIFTGANQRKRISRLNYEKEHGDIPKNWVVYHLDQDKDNDENDNLIAVPRAILIKLNNNTLAKNYQEVKTAIELYLKDQSNNK